MDPKKVEIVTIDGPAGAGKSTVAKALAQRLDFAYLDTGAMYRALTLKALMHGTKLDDEEALARLAKESNIELRHTREGLKVFLDKKNVTEEIRSLDVTNHAHYIARAAKVREIMVEWQRAFAKTSSLVIEGRDAGTVIFPKADYKFYLDANPQERCRRRLIELEAKGEQVDPDQLLQEIRERDQRDMTRSTGPLKKADDAMVVDSTGMDVDQVVNTIASHVLKHRAPSL